MPTGSMHNLTLMNTKLLKEFSEVSVDVNGPIINMCWVMGMSCC